MSEHSAPHTAHPSRGRRRRWLLAVLVTLPLTAAGAWAVDSDDGSDVVSRLDVGYASNGERTCQYDGATETMRSRVKIRARTSGPIEVIVKVEVSDKAASYAPLTGQESRVVDGRVSRPVTVGVPREKYEDGWTECWLGIHTDRVEFWD